VPIDTIRPRVDEIPLMSTITVSRPDVTTEEVSAVLRRGLGPRYKVLPGMGMNWNPLGTPRPGQSDKIVVGTGSARLFRAEVAITQRSENTDLHVIAGGLTALTRLPNKLWIAQKVRRVLRAAPEFQ
jgi:hypothetical protein